MSQGPVIIGFDGSPSAEHALRQAAALLSVREALVVTVWEAGVAYATLDSPAMQATPMDLGAAAMADQAMLEGVRQTAERGARIAREAGFEVEGEGLVVNGEESTATALVRLAAEREASVVVVGSHGHGRLDRFLMGSTSQHVVEHAGCPVLVVRTSER